MIVSIRFCMPLLVCGLCVYGVVAVFAFTLCYVLSDCMTWLFTCWKCLFMEGGVVRL